CPMSRWGRPVEAGGQWLSLRVTSVVVRQHTDTGGARRSITAPPDNSDLYPIFPRRREKIPGELLALVASAAECYWPLNRPRFFVSRSELRRHGVEECQTVNFHGVASSIFMMPSELRKKRTHERGGWITGSRRFLSRSRREGGRFRPVGRVSAACAGPAGPPPPPCPAAPARRPPPPPARSR